MTQEVTEAQVIAYLQNLRRPYSQEMFDALFAVKPGVTFELVVIVPKGEITHVALLPRPATDPLFAGLWHTPGAVMLAGDTPEAALGRAAWELGSHAHLGRPSFAGVVNVMGGDRRYECPRGQFVAQVFYTVLAGGALPPEASVVPASHLPENIIGCHHEIIKCGVMAYHDR